MLFMQVPSPSLLPILRSDRQGRILAAILLDGEVKSLSDVAADAECDLPSVQREVKRLEAGGLVTTQRRGNLRLVQSTENEVTEALRRLIAMTYGPVPTLRALVDGYPTVRDALVFGSYARRYAGEPGRVPNDIDVLVVTDDYDAYDRLMEDADGVGRRMRLTINTHRVKPAEWDQEPTPRGFLTTVKGSPTIPLKIGAATEGAAQRGRAAGD